jgi:hypothetical protein
MTHRHDPELHRLRRLVERLTAEHPEEVRDSGRLIGVRRTAPLLRDLAHARSANVGRGNGWKAPHERLSLNIGASELHTAIEQRVREWLTRTGWQRPGQAWPPVDQLLRAWYARVYLDPHLDPKPYAHHLAGWITAITDLLDPPYRFELGWPCPKCHADVIDGEADGEQTRHRALLATERPPDLRLVACRSCGATWHGEPGARTLAAELGIIPPASEAGAA